MYGQTLFMVIVIAHVLPIVVKDMIVDGLYPTLVKLVMEENRSSHDVSIRPPTKRRRLCLNCNQLLAKMTYWEQ